MATPHLNMYVYTGPNLLVRLDMLVEPPSGQFQSWALNLGIGSGQILLPFLESATGLQNNTARYLWYISVDRANPTLVWRVVTLVPKSFGLIKT